MTSQKSARARRALLALLFLLATPPLAAGLRFRPVAGPDGGDVRALLPDGALLWAGTGGGVWKLENGTWSRDGLPQLRVTALASSEGSLWAATGDALWRRGAGGSWTVETLPTEFLFPTTLAVSGGTLYVGGLGVLKRSGNGWTSLPSPGDGIVSVLVETGGSLVAGLSGGTAARLSGSSWAPLAGGVGPGEGFTALATLGSTLYGGTNRFLYTWTGVSWTYDTTFVEHPVRSLTVAGGVLRAATGDAGVLAWNGSGWSPDSNGLLPRGARTFASSGSDLLLGTEGGAVYRRSGSGWAPLGSGLAATRIVDSLSGGATAGQLVTGSAGAGLGSDCLCPSGGSSWAPLPDGCGDVRALAAAGTTAGADLLVATGCGPLAGNAPGWRGASSGLAGTANLVALAETSQGVLGGTSASGLWQWGAGGWSPIALPGLGNAGRVQALGTAGLTVYAALAEGLFAATGGIWSDAGSGLPSPGSITAVGGDQGRAFAADSAGAVYRREGTGAWKRDSIGLAGATVAAVTVAGGQPVAAGGTRGLFRQSGGTWAPETSGLPAGADVREVRAVSRAAGSLPAVAPSVVVGTAAHGAFVATAVPAVQTVPVVLDVVGGTGARFRTELTLGNRGSVARTVKVAFTAAPGFGVSAATTWEGSIVLAAKTERHEADAIAFLKALGLAIPDPGPNAPVAGSLTVSADSDGLAGAASGDLYGIARTYTTAPAGGTFGLFYPALSDLSAAEETADVYGLRSQSGVARSNLAVVHLPGRGTGPIDLEVQVYSASGVAAGPPLTKSLAPGEWYQWSGVLGLAGLPDGSYGYARVRRVGGTGAFAAYGVVNDAATSDGSYLPAYRPGGAAAARRVVVPVVLDVYGAAGSHFTTELTLANTTSVPTPVDVLYRPAPGFGSVSGPAALSLSLAAGQQRTIPDILQFLRDNGIGVPVATPDSPQAGTLELFFRYLENLPSGSTVALARTTTPNPDAAVGGAFGLFMAAVPQGAGARGSALVPALADDASVRSNLAVVHTGADTDLPITLSVRLYDAATGNAVGNALSVRLDPGDWYQWSRVLRLAQVPESVTRAYAVITRTAGDAPFHAYGVLNDNVTSDGSALEMIPLAD